MSSRNPAADVKKGAAAKHFDLGEVGRRVRAARAKIGMTRRQLAVLSGTSERYLAQIEAETANPSISVLLDLAQSLDMAPAELMPAGGERSAAYALAAAAVRLLPEAELVRLEKWVGKVDAAAHKDRRVALLGLRGAGKSELGKTLADRLRAPFLEMSEAVEKLCGASIGALLELGGQSALRRYEAEVWESIRKGHEVAVVAVPGGIVANPPLYERVLSTAHTVWLRASPADHMQRVVAQGDFRPMENRRGAMNDLKEILKARSPDYARADAVLDTSKHSLSKTRDLLEALVRAQFKTAL